MDFSRLRQGEIIAAVGGLALFIFMFLPWFGLGIETPDVEIPDIPGIDEGSVGSVPEVDDDLSAWDSLQDWDGFLLALAAGAGLALGGLAAAGKRLNLGGIRRGTVTAVLGSTAVAIILWRLLANPAELKYGIFLGLAAAIAITVGAVLALREDGIEPLADVAGGSSTRSKSSSSRAKSSGTRKSSTTRKRSSGGRK